MKKSLLKLICLSAMMTTISGCEIVFVSESTTPNKNVSTSTISSKDESSSSKKNDESSNSSSTSSSSSSSSSSNSSSSSSSSSSDNNGGAWAADLVELMTSNLGEEIPFVQLDEASLVYYDYVDDDGYPVVAIYDESSVNLLTNYDDILVDAGYEFYGQIGEEEYGYAIDFYSKGNVLVQYDYFPGDSDYPAGNEIYATVLELPENPDAPENEFPDSWPEDLIYTYFNGVSVPSVPGATEYLVTDYMDYLGFVVVQCAASANMEESYISTLENAGFTVEFDTEYEQYFAVDSTSSVQVDFYNDGEIFTVLLSEPVVALPTVWPEDLISSYYGVSIPAPENANVLAVEDYYDYDQTVVILVEGDETTLEAYLAVLAAANYTIVEATNAYYGECMRAINPEQTARVDLLVSDSGVVIEIGHYSEEEPVDPDTPTYTSESVMQEICVSIFGESEGYYSYEADYSCYATTAIFGNYTADIVYSYITTILPDVIEYAYLEEPMVDSYNGQDQYGNTFFDEAQTVAVEVICYYHSAQYGCVAQICVYNFNDYFTA